MAAAVGDRIQFSQRALDSLVANRRLLTRRIGGRVLIPVADLRKFARGDHPEHILADRRKLGKQRQELPSATVYLINKVYCCHSECTPSILGVCCR